LPVTLFVMAYSFLFSLVINDAIKFALIKEAGIVW
jgi:hypothetical protein